MTNSGKDIITERYLLDDHEGAALVSEEKNTTKGRARRAADKTEVRPKTDSKSKTASERSAGKKAKSEKAVGAAQKKQKPQHEETPSVRTPSVMKLVEDISAAENQVIAAGKSRIPRQLRGIEPLSRVIRREAEAENAALAVHNSPQVRKDLTGMIIEAEVPQILKRFNACDCERCCTELAKRTSSEIPARYITVPELADLSYTGFSDDEKLLIESVRKTVVSVMIRHMLGNKKKNFHE